MARWKSAVGNPNVGNTHEYTGASSFIARTTTNMAIEIRLLLLLCMGFFSCSRLDEVGVARNPLGRQLDDRRVALAPRESGSAVACAPMGERAVRDAMSGSQARRTEEKKERRRGRKGRRVAREEEVSERRRMSSTWS